MTEEQSNRFSELNQKVENRKITYVELKELLYLCRVGLAEVLGCTYEEKDEILQKEIQ